MFKRLWLLIPYLLCLGHPCAVLTAAAPLRVGIVGLAHGHVGGFLNGGALAPAGGLLHRSDAHLVGIVESDNTLYEKYAARYHWSAAMHFQSIAELSARTHPQALLIFTPTAAHRDVVLQAAALGIHVMMEKPMAISAADATAMNEAARRGHIHVLTDYETSWYASNKAAYDLGESGALGPLVKMVARDGHNGPRKIHVSPEFFAWLTDPAQNGAGALYDFGCYGADLMTRLMHGAGPLTVTAVTRHVQPEIYPKVDDEADILLTYEHAVGILQGSWSWPFAVKDTDIYGTTGYVKTVGPSTIEVRREGQGQQAASTAAAIAAPYDDPLHYLAAVIAGTIDEGDDVSSLKVNVIVSQILDAARQSAQSGVRVKLAEIVHPVAARP